MEQIRYNLLYRWFVGLEMEDKVWHHVTFSKNRERLLDDALMSRLFQSVLQIARRHRLIIGRAFQCGRHADRCLGLAQEFPAAGR